MDETEDLEELKSRARELSWETHGRSITFYHPGMFNYGGEYGRYPAVSITGTRCELHCRHCDGRLLEPMMAAETPEELLRKCRRAERRGDLGVLLSGGSSRDGSLPWGNFIEAIAEIKGTTKLLVSVHCGIMDASMARKLKGAGVDQALIDVIADDGTMSRVYGGDFGTAEIESTLAALREAAVPTVPHIIVGLDGGKLSGEYDAIDIVSRYDPEAVVVISFMPLARTPMADAPPPDADDVARVVASARLAMPEVPMSLGCARERGNWRIDVHAVEAGVNRMAIPSDEAIERAKEYGLELRWEKTCCSVPGTGGE